MRMEWTQHALTEEAVDQISERVQQACERLGRDGREKQRIRLTVEELLLRVREHSGESIRVNVGIGKRLGKQVFLLRYGGEPFNPSDYDEDDWSSRILATLDLSPLWSYRGRTNQISLMLAERVRHGTTFSILVAVTVAVLIGLLGRSLPEHVLAALDAILLTPVTNAFLGLLNTFAGLMAAFAICSGILGMGDSATLAKTGSRFLRQIVVLCTAAAALAIVLAVPVLRPPFSDAALPGFTQTEQLSEMLFAILPSDPVTPFLSKNTLQIIVIAMFVGIGLLALGEQGNYLRNVVNDGTALFYN